MAKLHVISTCLVPMATYSAISNSRIELTPWELAFLQLEPIQKGILLHKPHPSTASETLINHLKNSLSKTLSFFPPLAGRLGATKHSDAHNDTTCFFIHCNNAGAQFTHAVAQNMSVSDIVGPRYVPEMVSSFFPLNGVLNYEGISNPLLAVQVVELIDGFFIACTANHCIVDGTSFWHFFNSWAEISRGIKTLSKSPNFERWFPKNMFNEDNSLIPIHLFHQNHLQSFVPIPLLERVFHFSKESIANLKAKANSEAGASNVSSLQALLALLWRTVLRIRNRDGVKMGEKAVLYLLIGVRPRIPLPEGYFGNAVYVDQAEVNVEEILKNGLGFASMEINELVAKQTREAAVEYAVDWVKNPVLFNKGCTDFVVSSSPRFDVYGCDFGWGKPLAVRSGKGQKYDGKMTFYPAAAAGGIDVEACLIPETMKAMEDDAEFLEAITMI